MISFPQETVPLKPPYLVPLTGDQVFKYSRLWGTFLIQATTSPYQRGHSWPPRMPICIAFLLVPIIVWTLICRVLLTTLPLTCLLIILFSIVMAGPFDRRMWFRARKRSHGLEPTGGTALILGMAPCRVDRGKNEYGDVLKSRFLFPLGSSRT